MKELETYFNSMAVGWAAKYDHSPTFQERLRTVMQWIKQHEEGQPANVKLLDFGCGAGVVLRELAGMGFNISGVDTSPEMIARAKVTLQSLSGASEIRLELAGDDAKRPDILKERYDGILCLGVLEYVPHANEVLDWLADAVRPGGWLMLSLPNRESLFRLAEGGAARIIQRLPDSLRKKPGLSRFDYLAHQRHQWARFELLEEFRTRGLSVVEEKFFVAPFGSRHRRLGMNWIGMVRKQHQGPAQRETST